MGEPNGGALVHSACIECQVEIGEETQDGYWLLGVKRLGLHLYVKSLAPLWNFPSDVAIVTMRMFLSPVCAIIQCGLKAFVDQLEHLEFRLFYDFIVHISTVAGSAAEATCTGLGVEVRIRPLESCLLPFVFLMFAFTSLI